MYINLFNNVLSPKIPGYIVLWNVLQKLPPKAAGGVEEGAWGEWFTGRGKCHNFLKLESKGGEKMI